MKKKYVTLMLAALMIITLGACSNGAKNSDSSKKEESSASSTKKEEKKTSEKSESKPEPKPESEAKTELGNSEMFQLSIEAAQSQIPAIKAQAGDIYSDIKIEEGKDTTIIYTYTFSQNPAVAIDQEALRPTLIKGLKPTIDGSKGLFPDVKIQVIYLSPEGTELVNQIITQEDTDAIQ
ncbi:hypothetical protein [Isobaculum melis]|uniref:Lipoprotein n=1 Tax=Isobaculum melis TaxID=142588 RepID=A0A1H9TG19_9LACT|nr:hypothetical protein [Isobaculum melis]SER96081.1 hypothetical protein SAMN04488559_11332 [Isobaculum melis]